MDRRRATSLILSGSLAAPALVRPETAWAEITDDPASKAEAFQRVVLTLNPGLRTVVLSAILIQLANVVVYYNMQLQWQRFAASRADVSKIPLLGGLARPTVEKRMAGMDPVGPVLLAGTVLIILASSIRARRPEQMTVVNAGNEFTTKLNPHVVKQVEINKRHDRAERIAAKGALFDQQTGELIALIPPMFRQS